MDDGQSTENKRSAALVNAQNKAVDLFAEIEAGLVRPGISDKELSEKIYALASQRHGVKTHWHKRIVRSGPNTLSPFEGNPPNRVIQDDDILVVDLGPVFEEWEADFGRTYVLGNDPSKIKLRNALGPLWHKIKALYRRDPAMTGDKLYAIARQTVEDEGWEFGCHIAGHTVGDFPHERIPGDKISQYITKGNHQSMMATDSKGHRQHWILEVYLKDPEGKYIGFFEQLLTAE